MMDFVRHAVNTASCLVGTIVVRTFGVVRNLPRDQTSKDQSSLEVAEYNANKHLHPSQFRNQSSMMRDLLACLPPLPSHSHVIDN